jgi:Predicted dehydrogenases and related proteins
MEKIRVAIVGYGNIGQYTLDAIETAPDMVCVGVVRRVPSKEGFPELAPYKVVTDIQELGKVDVAILATPTRLCEEYAKQYLAMGINTVDSFDIHTSILDYRAA